MPIGILEKHVDVLGLETLPVIRRTLESIKKVENVEVDLYKIDMEDENIYKDLCNGDVSGVFQLNNQAQKVMEQQPSNFKDLIAINAMIRPGVADWQEYIARRKGKAWNVHHDRLAYMKETMGLIAYQEQYLLDAKTFAGWDIAYADKHIRKNKRLAEDYDLHKKFIEDSVARGYDVTDVTNLWQEIVEIVSGQYGFNKSHSASYAVISYQTAWLKHYYPEHFYASLMSSEKTDADGQDKIAGYIAECKQRGLKILPPDINESDDDFVIVKGGINYRITAIKHVGDSAIESIQALRPIKSFEDFMARREKRHIKRNVLVNLIKAGCFDFDNTNRADLLWQVDMENRTKKQIKEEVECTKYGWNDKIKAEWEKEVLGMYLSNHPMEKYGFKPLSDFNDGQYAMQGGEIYDMRIFKDKNSNEMCFAFINTLYGNIKVLIFSSTWKDKKIQEDIQIGNIVLIKGRRSGNDVILNEVEVLEKEREEEEC